mgnify:CR=1 FL=1
MLFRSGALGALFEFIRAANKTGVPPGVLATWRQLDSVLGFGIPEKSPVPAAIQALVEERQAARQRKDFQRADAIRDELQAQGWVIEDTPRGARAKRATG